MKLLIIMNYGPVERQENQTNQNIYVSGAKSVHLCINVQGCNAPNVNAQTFVLNDTNIGNARGLNQFYHNCKDFDMVAILADDIKLPQNWAKIAYEHIRRIPETGIIGFHCVQDAGITKIKNATQIQVPNKVFGVWCINPKVHEICGDFYDKMSLYGIWDSEYNERVKRAGFMNYYIWNKKSKHLGVQDTAEYRAFKNEQLKIAAKNYPKELITKYTSDVNRITIVS
jgi:hypothetical protein